MNKVYLVGAGSGDPELLTIKGERLLKTADVVLYDRLVNPLLLYLAPDSAELIYVGKVPHKHGTIQDEIAAQMITHAVAHKQVVRLKGGDPSIFGRVAEEMAVLEENNIPYEVVPGITSAVAATVYSGFAVTERFVSEKCLICTPTAKLEAFEEEPLAQIAASGMVVIYMGMEKIEQLKQIFFAQGSPADLPVAVIEWGTWGRQKKAVGTLSTIIEEVQKQKIANPAMIAVGKTAAKAAVPSWFEELPQFGRKLIYVTEQPLMPAEMFQYTAQGCDFYPVYVGEAYDERFDDLHRRLLPLYEQYELVYAQQTAEKAFLQLKEKLGIV